MSGPSDQSAATVEHYAPMTPFEGEYGFEAEEPGVSSAEVPSLSGGSPFVAEWEGEGGIEVEQRELDELLFELYDQEFEASLGALTEAAAAAAADRAELVGETAMADGAESFLEAWIQPLREEAEAMLGRLSGVVSTNDVAAMTDSEIDNLLDSQGSTETGLEPLFSNFLGGLLKKAKNVVKGAVKLAKRGVAAAVKAIPGLGMIIGRLKALVRPLLDRVLRMALNKLPPQLRGPARMLATRLLGRVGMELEGPVDEAAATPDIATLQEDFDRSTASLVLARDEFEAEALLAEVVEGEAPATGTVPADLIEARAELLAELESGVDPREAFERFIPAVAAVLPIARTAIGIVGRPRVVGFIAQFLARMIGPYVGPQLAPPLSRAIADTGLRTLSLEVPTEEETKAQAPAVVAGVVEDTVRRLAAVDEALLEDSLIEATTQEAFFEAAAENFPPSLLRPEVRETSRTDGTWVLMPMRGRRKYFKKYTKVFDVEITAPVAERVKTFGGVTLASYLQAKLGVTPPVRAKVHLYQATAGTWPGRITASDRSGGRSGRGAWAHLHPLTEEAAAALLGEPKLGRNVAGRFLASRHQLAVGQRLYRVIVPGARARTRPQSGQPARASRAAVAMDLDAGEIRVSLFLSEAEAQELAATVRKPDLPAAITQAKKVFESSLLAAVAGGQLQRVRTKVASAAPASAGSAPAQLMELLSTKLVAWTIKGFADQLTTDPSAFLNAVADETADGVTVLVTMASPPGIAMLRRAFTSGLPPAELAGLGGAFAGGPSSTVTITPGTQGA